ncbi:hypothetical protein R5W23_006259 [Gemmata sp. JC673]|uniref:Glycosyl hydrolase family 32 N-terminal domain-containing protein n=1 Tax=Gemmata algarum TaxID=2975278 RepID=A0ABU5EVR8_9BACT|nr:hypothetical protein [Gemmata algarum]MDY3559069.1 hypothetical protein [Gemmata algarum]
MRWEKKGLIYAPAGDRWWAKGYAHLPTALPRPDGSIRVYFAALDDNKFGRIGYVDLDGDDPARVLAESAEPVLDLGELGSFEDSGVVPSSVVETPEGLRLYYHGFQRTERIPYMIFTGLADGDAGGGTFARRSRVPLLDRTPDEPFLRGAPCVLAEGGGYRMWYVSCTHWSETGGKLHYNNVIRHATSPDGLRWAADPVPCLEPLQPDEYSVGRPWVVRFGGEYHMWYSSRSHSQLYAISHARSADGLTWTRDPDYGIERSPAGWDGEIICYANVIPWKGRWLMFYNGNGHGRSGFGHAVLGAA